MFHDESDALIANPPMLGYGVAVFDSSGYGDYAFAVAGYGFPNRILAWDGQRLLDQYHPVIYSPDRNTLGIAAGDIDGDGNEELYCLNADTFGGYTRMGDQLFAVRDGDIGCDLFALPQNSEFINHFAGRSVCMIDPTGSGKYMAWVANYGGPMRLYKHILGDHLIDVAADLGVDQTTGGRALIAGPIISPPGHTDLFAATENGPNLLFLDVSTSTVGDVASDLGITDEGSHGRGTAILSTGTGAEFGIVATNWQDEHRFWVLDMLGTFLDVASPDLRRPSAARKVICADFDNCGNEEILINNMDQPNRLLKYIDGQWVRIDAGDASEPDGCGTGMACCDIDGDGRLEVLISHGESAMMPLTFLRPLGGYENNWLRIAPLTRFGAPARGAFVEITVSGRTQKRIIDGGSGYLCQNEPVAHFGLGTADAVQTVRIVWPGGATHIVMNPDINRIHRINHPEG